MIARRSAVPLPSASVLILVAVSLAAGMAFAWPFLLRVPAGGGPLESPVVLVAILPLLVAVALVEVTAGRLDARALAMLGVLSAIGAVVRALGAGTAGVETVFVVLVLGGRVFGPGFGFVLGSTTLFASALLTGGVGPWLPFQMLAASWVGLGAGLLPPARRRGEIVLLIGYGVVAAFVYGVAMNLWSWPFAAGLDTGVSFVAGAPLVENVQRFVAYSLVTSLGWEVGRAVTTAILVVVVGPAVLATLGRAARRASFGTVTA